MKCKLHLEDDSLGRIDHPLASVRQTGQREWGVHFPVKYIFDKCNWDQLSRRGVNWTQIQWSYLILAL